MQAVNKLPEWLKQEIPDAAVLERLHLLSDLKVNTVCRQAHCPNLSYCFGKNELTFMILGNICTRHCRFCAVEKNGEFPQKTDSTFIENRDNDEPLRIRRIVEKFRLNYVVVTSVTRDDLDDGGAGIFARTVTAIHSIARDIKVEVLIPDFLAKVSSIKVVLGARPAVVAHNLETVKRLSRELRPDSSYERSLELLRQVKAMDPQMLTKSSLMLGLGEDGQEVEATMEDLRHAGCDMLTLGQYLAPDKQHYPVSRFVTPDEFKRYESIAAALGFKAVLSGPKVRSSFGAEELYNRSINYV